MYIYRKGTEIVLNSFDSNWARPSTNLTVMKEKGYNNV